MGDSGGAATRRLGVAVIGTGFVGPFHVDAIRRAGYADVLAVVGSDPKRTADRAAALGVPNGSTDLAAVLADPAIDVVHVCTPNRTHVEIASAVLAAGKHVVVEKPVGIDSNEASTLLQRTRDSGLHAAVALTYRGYPMVQRARALVADGSLGDLRLVHGGYIQDWLSDAGDYNWRLETEIGGASRAVGDIGSHWFDTAEFITGDRIVEVFADLATLVPTRRRPSGGSVAFAAASGPAEEVAVTSEDAATLLIRFAGGARGACVVSQVSPGRKNAFTLEIAGSRSTISWDQEDAEHLWVRAREEARLLTRTPVDGANQPGVPSLPAGHPEGWAEALRDALRPFYQAVATGTSPAAAAGTYPDLESGVRGVRFVEAVLRSARDARWVRLDA
jgi:predicted dehydrogenase